VSSKPNRKQKDIVMSHHQQIHDDGAAGDFSSWQRHELDPATAAGWDDEPVRVYDHHREAILSHISSATATTTPTEQQPIEADSIAVRRLRTDRSRRTIDDNVRGEEGSDLSREPRINTNDDEEEEGEEEEYVHRLRLSSSNYNKTNNVIGSTILPFGVMMSARFLLDRLGGGGDQVVDEDDVVAAAVLMGTTTQGQATTAAAAAATTQP
jgi:hypothetical protein